MFDLTGKVALVTGASGDIGRAVAAALHGQGAAVALSGTRRERLEALAAELGDRTAVAPGDLADPAAPDAVVKAAEAALGPVEVLVNNAGLTRDNLAMRMKDAEFEEVLQVNLMAAFRLIRAVMKGMMKRRAGRIVNVSSVVAHVGNPGQANYTASKAGLAGMSRSLAAELAPRGVTVNCVAPGFVTSAMTDGLDEQRKARLLAMIPLGRMGDPADVAAAVAYLASDEASYVTGQTLHINGGMAMF
jgi:3-oxoacyl-[acyl-carrier protein] reductase